MRLLLLLLCMSTPATLAGEFLVMVPGSSAAQYDRGRAQYDYVTANGLNSDTAPEGMRAAVLRAEKANAIINDLGTDPANTAKLAAIEALGTYVECRDFMETAETTQDAPSCYVTWTDTIFTDCSTLTECGVPGAQLCNVVGAVKHTMVRVNLTGTVCASACKNDDYRLRVTCP